jgi:hypothetical protein
MTEPPLEQSPQHEPLPVTAPAGASEQRMAWRRRPAVIAGVSVATAVIVAAGAFSRPGPFTARGTVENDNAYAPLSGGAIAHAWVADSNQPGRCLDNETIDVMATIGGRSVTVATGTLAGQGNTISNGP